MPDEVKNSNPPEPDKEEINSSPENNTPVAKLVPVSRPRTFALFYNGPLPPKKD